MCVLLVVFIGNEEGRYLVYRRWTLNACEMMIIVGQSHDPSNSNSIRIGDASDRYYSALVVLKSLFNRSSTASTRLLSSVAKEMAVRSSVELGGSVLLI